MTQGELPPGDQPFSPPPVPPHHASWHGSPSHASGSWMHRSGPPPGGFGPPTGGFGSFGAPASGGIDPPGPPPPPWERERRTRRRAIGIVVGVVAVVAALVGAVLLLEPFGDTEPDDTAAAPPDEAPDSDERTPDEVEPDARDTLPDADPPPDDVEVPVPDLGELEGADAVFGQLLVEIDASERAMITFQDELIAAFEELGDQLDPTELIERIREAAGQGAARLTTVRSRMETPLEVEAAEAVRVVYVDHLDAWLAYMLAVEEDPSLLGTEEERSRYILRINTSAAEFARALEEELPADAAPEVSAFAEGILDRGFRVEFESDA